MSPYWATKWYSREEPYFPKDLKEKLNKVEASIYLKMFRIRKKNMLIVKLNFNCLYYFQRVSRQESFRSQKS